MEKITFKSRWTKVAVLVFSYLLPLATYLSTSAQAQTAKSVLDKAAATVTMKEGVKADFKMTGSMGSTSGTIIIKGKKFHATTPQASVWFDGKTQWTYMKDNDEVNISHLTASTAERKIKELFITVDKKSYRPTQVKLLQGKKWTIFDITGLKKQPAADSQFRFNAKEFPHAEVIDLR